MNLAQAAAAALFFAFRGSSTKLRLQTVQEWMDAHSDPDSYGRGYAGSSLRRGPSDAFIEITKTSQGSRFNVDACVYLSPRSAAVATQEWRRVSLSGDLEKFFGGNNRVRVNI